MTHRITFEVPGKPQPKQRARRGVHGRWYTPKATKTYEGAVGLAGVVARGNWQQEHRNEYWPRNRRYRLVVTCYMPDRRTRDADNVLKSVADALNGVLWRDDNLVVETTARKELDRDNPRTLVEVEVMPEQTDAEIDE